MRCDLPSKALPTEAVLSKDATPSESMSGKLMEVIAEIADSIVDETNILASGSRYAPLDGTCMFEDPLVHRQERSRG